MAKNRRNVAFKQCEQIEFEIKNRRKAKEKLRRKQCTPMTKAQFRYCAMRDLRLLEGYYDDLE